MVDEHSANGQRTLGEIDTGNNKNNDLPEAKGKLARAETRQDKTVAKATTNSGPGSGGENNHHADIARQVMLRANMTAPPADMHLLREWLDNGCDPVLDIYPTVDRLAARRQVGSFRYFDKAILEARANRKQADSAEVARWQAGAEFGQRAEAEMLALEQHRADTAQQRAENIAWLKAERAKARAADPDATRH